jgi:hypothetical protein
LGGRVRRDGNRRLEQALTLLVGKAPVDHLVGGRRQALGHRRVLPGRLGKVPSVEELVGEGDPESGAEKTSSPRAAPVKYQIRLM